MMRNSGALVASVVLAATVSACGRTPRPAAVAPTASAAQAGAQRFRADSLAAAARWDSAQAAARRDSLAEAVRTESRADSVRAQVLAGGGSDQAAAAVASGLAPAELAVLEDRVHFAFNKADISSAEAARLDRKLVLLRAYPRLRIEIAGHCDERGSDEYNLALGQRRAAMARRYLVEYGIAAERISIVSYGEEQPFIDAHTEEAWAANRRAEFRVTQAAR